MNLVNYDALLFDWDGTLARSLELWLDEIYKQHIAYGLKVSRAENARGFGDLSTPLRRGLPPEKYDQFQTEINERVQQRLPDVPLYDDAGAMLRALKKAGKKLALITTSTHKSMHLVMGRHDVEHLFDVIITAEDVQSHKPDPEGINVAIERLGVEKKRAIMLGDNNKDLLAAKNAGIDSVLFYPPAHEIIYTLQELEAHGPRYTIRAWQELLDQLQ